VRTVHASPSAYFNFKSLNEPFKPKKQPKQQQQQTTKQIKIPKETDEFVEKNQGTFRDNWLGRLAQRMFAPKPFNVLFREKYNIDKNFKLIYLLPNERSVSLIFFTGHCVSLFIGCMLTVIVAAETTGASNFRKSLEKPYQVMSAFTLYFLFVYAMVVSQQRATVLRIYHNKAANEFALIRKSGLISFKKVEFKARDVVAKLENTASVGSLDILKNNLAKTMGNVKINGHGYHIDAKNFNSEQTGREFYGQKAMGPKTFAK
jgi:hypothetical protein